MLTQPGASLAVGFSGLTNARTGKARFPSAATKRWQSQPAAAKRQLPRDEMVEVYFNDTPLLRKIAYDQNQNSYTAAYQLYENTSDTLYPEDGNGFLHFTKAKTLNPNGYNPHTETLPASQGTKGQRQIWIDSTSGSPATVTITCNFTPTAASAQGGIQVYRYNSGDEDFDGLPNGSSGDPGWIPFVAGTATYTWQPTISDDYAFQVVAPEEDLLNAGFQVSFSTTTAIWCHLPSDGFLEDIYKYARGKIRMLAHDVLIKNGASELNDQGFITCARLQDDSDWYDMIIAGQDNSVYTLVSNYGDDSVRWLNQFKRGLHTWMLPNEEGWQKLSVDAKLAPRELIEYDMVYRRDFCWWPPLIVCISSINPENGTVITGCDALFVENQWMEYTTNNKQDNAAISYASPLEWLQALWLCNYDGIAREVDGEELEIMSKNWQSSSVYDNPGHISRFFERVGNVMNALRPVLKPAIAYGAKKIAQHTGNQQLANSAARIAEEIMNGVGSMGSKKRK